MVTRLITDKPLDPSRIGERGAAFLMRETGQKDLEMLQEALSAACADAAAVIDAALVRPPAEGGA